MSRLRRFRRRRARVKRPEKTRIKMSRSDVLLMLGLTSAILGSLVGALYYQAYTAGLPAGISSHWGGARYAPETSPGNELHMTAATCCFTSAGVGAGLSVVAYIIKFVSKRHTVKEEAQT